MDNSSWLDGELRNVVSSTVSGKLIDSCVCHAGKVIGGGFWLSF